VVSHCHLNANTKVHGLADYPGARREVVAPLIERGVGLVQLPCPEATYLGMKRWGMTREQYDTPAYRRHCAELLAPTVDTLRLLAEDDCVIERVIGVDGSPSCGVDLTSFGYAGGEIEDLVAAGDLPTCHKAPGLGVFMEVFRSMLDEVGLEIAFNGVDEASAESAN
jgi:predicted secreted protein